MKGKELEGWCAGDTPTDGYASEEEINLPKLVGEQNKKKNKSRCGFQALGLSQPILKGISNKGYKIPTPIQRQAIPPILDGKDVVAMARTGSGKTAAFLIPLFERLKVHSAHGSGIRGLILSPTRELALQTLNFAKQLGKYTGIRAALVLGGDSMEVQFQAITDNPDVVIATPGRFMHVCIQMNLNLSSVVYVVFDEADRLFEMGFSEQLQDIIRRLSTNRQSLLFSATLPKMLVEFARAGLTDPVLIRLDVENKISENLKLGFFKIRPEERVPLLLHLLKNVIDIGKEPTVIFVPTKHHVEYLHMLLEKEGINNSFIYSTLDPAARKINADKFIKKKVNLLIVTDIAARGIDIPLLDNVINYNFPAKTKLFIHRVGRVARAGRKGAAYSFVTPDETAYLIDLHMFLDKSIRFATQKLHANKDEDWNLVLGTVPRDILDENIDHVSKVHEMNYDLEKLKKSADNGYKKYRQSCAPASAESVRRLKNEMWDREMGCHPLLLNTCDEPSTLILANERNNLLESLRNSRPKMTIFEVKRLGKKTKNCSVVQFMVDKRKTDRTFIDRHYRRLEEKKALIRKRKVLEEEADAQRKNIADETTDSQLDDSFVKIVGKRSKKAHKETEENQHFIPYYQADKHTEEALAISGGFERDTNNAALDIHADDMTQKPQTTQRKQWDRIHKKYVGVDMPKRVKTESGVWVTASYTQDLYKRWKLKALRDKEEMDYEDDDAQEEPVKPKEPKEPLPKDTHRFVTLNENVPSKRHPLLQGKSTTGWNLPGKRKQQQVKSGKELYTYEEMTKNIRKKKFNKLSQAQRTFINKQKKKANMKKLSKRK